MLKLHARISQSWDADPFVARISETGTETGQALVVRNAADANLFASEPAIILTFEPIAFNTHVPVVLLPQDLRYLEAGDILRVIPRTGEIVTLYRRRSSSNSLLLTERCNSRCVMCSQPPKDAVDDHLLKAYLDAIPLIDPDTAELGLTGGEPTLLGPEFVELLAALKTQLPRTSIHVLSNGRLFRYLSLAVAVANVAHPDLVIGVPLYSDIASYHDHVVQARGAFDQTVRGIMNLKRCGQRVEVRVVLHRLTIDRLPSLARFIARNLPNVDHVAFMGLEMMGFVKMNLDGLWIDPADYQAQLRMAVQELEGARLNVSIYNHQLCVLEPGLWKYARKSISDWKNEYLATCASCAGKEQCGGFFTSAKLRYSDHINALNQEDLPANFTSQASEEANLCCNP